MRPRSPEAEITYHIKFEERAALDAGERLWKRWKTTANGLTARPIDVSIQYVTSIVEGRHTKNVSSRACTLLARTRELKGPGCLVRANAHKWRWVKLRGRV